jgi:hypothetical protein
VRNAHFPLSSGRWSGGWQQKNAPSGGEEREILKDAACCYCSDIHLSKPMICDSGCGCDRRRNRPHGQRETLCSTDTVLKNLERVLLLHPVPMIRIAVYTQIEILTHCRETARRLSSNRKLDDCRTRPHSTSRADPRIRSNSVTWLLTFIFPQSCPRKMFCHSSMQQILSICNPSHPNTEMCNILQPVNLPTVRLCELLEKLGLVLDTLKDLHATSFVTCSTTRNSESKMNLTTPMSSEYFLTSSSSAFGSNALTHLISSGSLDFWNGSRAACVWL